MTAQMPDQILWKGQKYYLHSSLQYYASPQNWGIQCMPMHTGCFRGYEALFAIENDQLYLMELTLYTKEERPPPIHGVQPSFDGHYFHYTGIMLPIAYTGKLAFGREFDTNYGRTKGDAAYSDSKAIILTCTDGRVSKSGLLQQAGELLGQLGLGAKKTAVESNQAPLQQVEAEPTVEPSHISPWGTTQGSESPRDHLTLICTSTDEQYSYENIRRSAYYPKMIAEAWEEDTAWVLELISSADITLFRLLPILHLCPQNCMTKAMEQLVKRPVSGMTLARARDICMQTLAPIVLSAPPYPRKKIADAVYFLEANDEGWLTEKLLDQAYLVGRRRDLAFFLIDHQRRRGVFKALQTQR